MASLISVELLKMLINGSTEEDDTEDYENSGIELPETAMYKNVKISINKKEQNLTR